MALTKKHFITIAAAIADEATTIEQNPLTTPAQASAVKVALRNVAINLCVAFREENPAFDGQRFLKECGF